ncbi:hypothetical protein Tco_0308281 [Tanacetum coccineum]
MPLSTTTTSLSPLLSLSQYSIYHLHYHPPHPSAWDLTKDYATLSHNPSETNWQDRHPDEWPEGCSTPSSIRHCSQDTAPYRNPRDSGYHARRAPLPPLAPGYYRNSTKVPTPTPRLCKYYSPTQEATQPPR